MTVTTADAPASRLGWGCAAVAVLAFLAAVAGIGVPATPVEQVAVDEPQYLLTAMSIARDGDLDIANQLAERQWREFTTVEPPEETVAQPDGSRVSPHDPLLPLLLAGPVAAGDALGVGGWVGAKVALALLAATLAALTLWVAVRRFGVPVPPAAVGVGVAAASAPLAVYGQQVYPELPAALACLVGVAALTGTPRRSLVVVGLAVVALPWLSIKYAPVAAALVVVGVVRWWRHGHRADAAWFVGALAVASGMYAAVHVAVWGGVTVYAGGDHFQESGQLGVMGEGPSFLFRSWRLMDLLVDRTFGLVAWQPAWLLLVPAMAAVVAARSARAALVLPLTAGWLVATYPALTMHGYWWPGRQVVVVLPLALLIVLCWLATAGRAVRVVAAVLGAAGVFTYGCLLLDGHTGEVAWVNHYTHADAPAFHALHPVLAHYGTSTSNVVWIGILAVLAVAGYAGARRGAGRASSTQASVGKNDTGPATVSPTSSSARTG